jgi:hypothetical protein
MTSTTPPDHAYEPARKGYERINGRSGNKEFVVGNGPCKVCGRRHLNDRLAAIITENQDRA